MVLEEKRYFVYVDDEKHPIVLKIYREAELKNDDEIITKWVVNVYGHGDFKYYDLDSLETHTWYLNYGGK